MKIWSLFACLILSVACSAAEPIADVTASPGRELRVLQARKPGRWILKDDQLKDVPAQLYSDGSLAVLDLAPGVYHVFWRPALGPWQQREIVVGKPVPTPPKPKPPKPKPVERVVAIVVVEETAEPPAGIDMAKIRLSGATGAIAAACKAAGISWRCVDQDAIKDLPDYKPWADAAKGKNLPWLVGTSAAGKVVLSERLPKDEAAMLARLKEVVK